MFKDKKTNRNYTKILLAGALVLALLSAVFVWKGAADRDKAAQEGSVPQLEYGGGPLVINEVCLLNKSVLADSKGSFHAWAEIYNPSGEAVSLDGWTLSDKKNNLMKYAFPKDREIGPGQYQLVYLGKPAKGEEAGAVGQDLYAGFKLTRSETLYLSFDRIPTDYVKVPGDIKADMCYGRKNDDQEELTYLSPTPAASNKDARELAVVEAPVFSQASGFYDQEFSLEISAPEGTRIYYTLDSSVPTDQSQAYSGPIPISDPSDQPNVYAANMDLMPHVEKSLGSGTIEAYPGYFLRYILPETVDKCAVVRAVAVDGDGNVSDVTTASYFINYQNKTGYKDIATISLVSDPDGIFGEDKGIMVNGKEYMDQLMQGYFKGRCTLYATRKYTNSYKGRGREWERQTHVDYFSAEDQSLLFSQEAGLRLHGNNSRVSKSQKSFNLYAREDYDGNDTFLAPFFDSGLLSDTVTLLRGHDLRAYYGSALMSGRTMDAQDYKMVQVFLDGEYWGIYALQERYASEAYMEGHYGLNTDDYYLLAGSLYGYKAKNHKEDTLKATETSFRILRDFAASADLSDDKNYDKLCSMMDIDSFIDVYAARLYSADADWSWYKNMYLLFYDNKWHWLIYDIDGGFGAFANSDPDMDSFSQPRLIKTESLATDPFFPHLMENDRFRRQFVNTFMDLANYTFEENKVRGELTDFYTRYREACAKSSARYPEEVWSLRGDLQTNFYQDLCTELIDFFSQRDDYIIPYMQSYFSLTGNKVSVTIHNDQPEAGRIRINSISPDLDKEGNWTGSYFTDYPVTLTAQPEEGWQFVGWKTKTGTLADKTALSTDLSFDGDTKVTALFKKVQITDQTQN